MAFNQFDLSELLDAARAGDSLDLIRESVEMVLQALIDAEATAFIGAEPHERTDTRTIQRNGSRSRLLATKAGDVNLAIPKLRHGSFFPSILDRRRRIDAALYAVVMEAYVHGVSTRKVDDLVAALGAASGISKSEVSRICAELDVTLSAFRDRPLDHIEFPYVFLDATYVKARSGGRIVSKAVIVATGVSRNGDREVLGVEVGARPAELSVSRRPQCWPLRRRSATTCRSTRLRRSIGTTTSRSPRPSTRCPPKQLDINAELERGGLQPIASGQGHDAAISIGQRDAVLWGGRLKPGEVVTVPDGRHVRLFVALGDASLDGAGALAEGDAVRLNAAGSPALTAGSTGAEVLIWVTA